MIQKDICNPKKRLFTKEFNIKNTLNALKNGMQLNLSKNQFESDIKWSEIPDGANLLAGHLPDIEH